jgi:glucan 1,3-beta-glucosidase
MEDFL